MATIEQIETNLVLAASTANATLFKNTVSSITTDQIPLVNASIYGDTLYYLTQPNNASQAASLTRTLIAKVGAYVPEISIGNAMVEFSKTGNYAALDAVTDYLTAGQKAWLADSPVAGSFFVTATLANIITNDRPWESTDDTAIANAARDLMKKLGSAVEADALGRAIEISAQNGNFAALDAVTDYLTADQKAWLGGSPATSNTLRAITMHDQPWESSDDTKIASVVRDFMVKLGATVDHYALGDAMLTFAQNGNFAALDAVTDYLTTDQKAWLSDSPAVSNTLRSIMMHDQPWESSDDTQIAAVVRDFMAKLGATVDHYALGDVPPENVAEMS